MEFEFDPAKNGWNIENRGLSFADVEALEWDTALVNEDKRRDYKERRFSAFARREAEVFNVVFTWRDNRKTMRIISYRRANKRERKDYEEETRSLFD